MSSYLRHCSSRLPGKTCSRERNNFPLRLSGEWCSTPPSRSLHAVLARVIGHRCTTRCFFSRHQVACSQSNTRNAGWKYNLLTAHPRFPGHFSDRLFFFFFFFFCFPRNRNLSISRRKRVGQILEQILWGERILGQMQKRNGRNKRAVYRAGSTFCSYHKP
ncbi:AHG_G0055200.mRNA.1.CDS.1 [Saccharomyces cerevisiae]|nr:AHG_G0055200.mRNA.1.CDS.1 [Saccharomyces cerevisiae]CAI6907801.1 AHG_G0055200.mRNA.1.CDS.1 [Saccharomyces cerevisiae]